MYCEKHFKKTGRILVNIEKGGIFLKPQSLELFKKIILLLLVWSFNRKVQWTTFFLLCVILIYFVSTKIRSSKVKKFVADLTDLLFVVIIYPLPFSPSYQITCTG